MTPLGEWLTAQLKKHGWTQAELAHVSGVKEPTISRLINGQRGIGKDAARKLADALGVEPEDIFRAAGEWSGEVAIDARVQKINSLVNAMRDLTDDEIDFIEGWVRNRNNWRGNGKKRRSHRENKTEKS